MDRRSKFFIYFNNLKKKKNMIIEDIIYKFGEIIKRTIISRLVSDIKNFNIPKTLILKGNDNMFTYNDNKLNITLICQDEIFKGIYTFQTKDSFEYGEVYIDEIYIDTTKTLNFFKDIFKEELIIENNNNYYKIVFPEFNKFDIEDNDIEEINQEKNKHSYLPSFNNILRTIKSGKKINVSPSSDYDINDNLSSLNSNHDSDDSIRIHLSDTDLVDKEDLDIFEMDD